MFDGNVPVLIPPSTFGTKTFEQNINNIITTGIVEFIYTGSSTTLTLQFNEDYAYSFCILKYYHPGSQNASTNIGFKIIYKNKTFNIGTRSYHYKKFYKLDFDKQTMYELY